MTAVILGGGCYLAAALLAVIPLRHRRPRGERACLVLLGAGALALGGVLVWHGIRAGALPAFTRFEALTGYTLAVTLVYLLLMAFRPTRGLSTFIIPYLLAVLTCGFSAVAAAAGPAVPLQGPWLVLHVASACAAYAVFTLTSLLAAAYLVQDHNLKHRRLGPLWERLPPLETLDHVMSRLAGLAFLLFTVAIMAGFILVRQGGGAEAWITDPKVVATLATWLLFGAIVHMRANADRHGRGVALLTVAGLACMLFAFVGVHLVADSVHAFLLLRGGPVGP